MCSFAYDYLLESLEQNKQQYINVVLFDLLSRLSFSGKRGHLMSSEHHGFFLSNSRNDQVPCLLASLSWYLSADCQAMLASALNCRAACARV